jgi:hypothetical protein
MSEKDTSAPAEETLQDAAPELKPLSIFDICETDDEASENGKWFKDIFFPDDGVEIKLRRFSSQKSVNYRTLLLKKYARHAKNDQFPPEIDQRMMIEQLAAAIIVDWKGIRDREGKEIPYSQPAALQLCKMLDFRAPLIQRAMSMDGFRTEQRKEVEGNS